MLSDVHQKGKKSKICLAQLSPSGEKNNDGQLPRQRAGAAPSPLEEPLLLLKILDVLDNLLGNNGIPNEMLFFESVYLFIYLFFG